MSRALIVLGILCLLPYAYMVYFWGFCEACTPTGDSWVYSLALLFALPFLLAGYAIVSAISGVGALRDNMAEGRPLKMAGSGLILWLAVIVAIPAIYASSRVYDVLFPEVEEGRDRLGRICEKQGNKTICRPDPEATGSALDDLNRANRKQRGS